MDELTASNPLNQLNDDNELEIIKCSQIASSPWRIESTDKRQYEPSSEISDIVSSCQSKRSKWDFASEELKSGAIDGLNSSPTPRKLANNEIDADTRSTSSNVRGANKVDQALSSIRNIDESSKSNDSNKLSGSVRLQPLTSISNNFTDRTPKVSRSKSDTLFEDLNSSSSFLSPGSPPPISSSQSESFKFKPVGRPNFAWNKASSNSVSEPRSKLANSATESRAKPASRSTSKMTVEEKEAQKTKRQAEKQMKEAEKQKEKLLREANKKKYVRQDCSKELLVDLYGDLSTNSKGDLICQAVEQLSAITCLDMPSQLDMNYIGFRRKKTSEYDDEQEMFVPIDETISTEKHIVLISTAEEFVQDAENKKELFRKLKNCCQKFQDFNIIYLLEGYAEYMKKIANSSNRQMVNQVRQLLNADGSPVTASQSTASIKDKNHYDALLIEISVTCGIIIFHTSDDVDTAEWIGNFACDIYAAPYKQIQNKNKDIRAGTNPSDTVAKAFSHVTYVTPSVAASISEIYPTMYHVSASVKKRGAGAFSGIKSQSMGRLINTSVCSTLAKLFSSRDPETVVME